MKIRTKKLLTMAIVIGIIASILVGCSTEEKQPEETETESTETTMIDRAGNEITIPENLETIVSMGPSITEVLIDLGYGDKIVATDTYSEGLEGLSDDILYQSMMSPDIEQIIALDPDFIFATGMMMVEGADPFEPVRNLGIPIAYIPSSESIEEIYEDTMFICKVLEEEEKGQEIIEDMKVRVAEIKEIGETITDKRSVYFEIAAPPNMVSFGEGVYQNEMLEIIGAINVLGDLEDWISVSDEAVVAANPDVIITNVTYIEDPVQDIKSRAGWENIDAIKNDEVYYVDNNTTSRPNHNIIKGLEAMAKVIYPEKY